MNNEEKRKAIHELVDMVLDLNGIESRQQKISGAKPTGFIDFSGHVNCLYIRVYPDGWSSDNKENIAFDINLDEDFTEDVEKVRHILSLIA